MKKIILVFAIASISLFTFSLTITSEKLNSISQSDIEALTSPEGIDVICRCAGFLGNNECKASNSKAICASGNNIQCQSWNGNC